MQANNAYIFPAIGFAAILTRASHISDDAFLVAAKCLSEMTQKAVSSLPWGLIPLSLCLSWYAKRAMGASLVITGLARTSCQRGALCLCGVCDILCYIQEAYRGLLFPRFQSIQAVSLKLTCEVARLMVGPDGGGQLPEELAGQTNPDWEAFVASRMYKPLPNAKL